MLHKTTQVRACREGEPVLVKWLTNLPLKATLPQRKTGLAFYKPNTFLPRCPTQVLTRQILPHPATGGTGILDLLD